MTEEIKARIVPRLRELEPIARAMAKDAALLTFPITLDGEVYKAVFNKKLERFEYVEIKDEKVML
jgi:hypothetical protein